MKKIIIAEKPSVAREIASVLGVANKATDGTYLFNDEYAVTWAFGHLVSLYDPEDYKDEWKVWSWETLPMIPTDFKLCQNYKVDKDKEGKRIKVVDDGVKKQLNSIKNLFTNGSEIIVATDAGREGELIFRLIYEYLGIRKPFSRLWISSLTKDAIDKGFKNLQAGNNYDNLYNAAFCRAKADWLLGLNSTRALTVTVKQTFPMGRVQTPTLCLIIQRFLENKNFVPQKYFQVRLNLTEKNQVFFALSVNTYPSASIANELTNKLRTLQSIIAKDVAAKVRNENPPLLFDLTQLQADCNRKFGLSANDTLEIAQSLYEKKIISYPRTGSRHISQDIFAEIPDLIKSLKNNISVISDSPNYSNFQKAIFYLENSTLNSISVNDKKVTDHHALLPTNYRFNLSDISGSARQVYELILSRTLETFHQVCIKDITTITFNEFQENFTAKGVVIKQQGWRSVLNEVEEIEENEGRLPILQTNDSVSLIKPETLEKITKAKPLHNEASLLKLMETAGKDITNELIRDAMKEGGLGTPATRASIIEGLLSRKYITREKKYLIPTDRGLALYDFVHDKKLGKPDLTGEWELKLSKIEKGEFSSAAFMKEIELYTNVVLDEIKQESGSVVAAVQAIQQKQEDLKPDCPICKAKMNVFEKGIFCSDKTKECKFVIWRNQRGKDLTDNQLIELIVKKKTKTMKFKSKVGKEYEGFLSLNSDNSVELNFANKK